jgi:hypothetical protein
MRRALQDLRRIKQEGPRLDDLTQSWPFEIPKADGSTEAVEYTWVPKEVITGSGRYELEEPEWASLPQMPYMRFYQARGRIICACCLLPAEPASELLESCWRLPESQ